QTAMIDTWIAEQPDPEAFRESRAETIPQGRFATPEEVAAAVVYLASDEAAPEHGLDGFWEARVARGALEAEQTGVAFFRLKPGRRSAFAHRHDEAEEIYVVLRGRGRM